MSDLWDIYGDVPGQCNAHCYIGDNYGDGSATMRCSLEVNHEGWHKETFRDDKCILTWEKDERCYHTAGYEYNSLMGTLCCMHCCFQMSEPNWEDDGNFASLDDKFQLVKWDGNKFIAEPKCKHKNITEGIAYIHCNDCGDRLGIISENPELSPI
jgi:hypothetical protein